MIIATILLVAAATFGGIAALHLAAKVPQPVKWPAGLPVVVDYEPLLSGYQTEIHDAIVWWNQNTTSILIFGGQGPVDKAKIHFVVRGQAFAEDHVGQTTRVQAGKVIQTATIELPIALDSEEALTVIRHELGHALGYDHAAFTGSVMAPTIAKMGDSTQGLK